MWEFDTFLMDSWTGISMVKMMVYLIPIVMVGLLAFAVIRTRRREGTAKMFHCSAIVRDRIAKRARSGNGEQYWVVFEMDNGKRKELRVAAELYGILEVNDRGSLSYQGNQILSFKRQVC